MDSEGEFLNNILSPILESFSSRQVLVLGDFLLDEFIFGEISRISREAPVLILSYRETDWRPGGGANTVAGVAALGARPIPVGLVGADPWGERLLDLWGTHVPRDHVTLSPDVVTTRKTRILAGSMHSFRQQVTRIDYEHPHQLNQQQEAQVASSLEELIPQVDAIIISDYSLGTVTKMLGDLAITVSRKHGRPIVVDSRFRPNQFRGATSITPNISEVEYVLQEKLSHLDQLEKTGSELREKWNLDSLLVTRGRHGMTLFEEGSFRHLPAYGTDQVADVTGAGDTVTATFTTALAGGATFEQAARLANIAGGIVVTKRGTASVSLSELRQASLGEDS